MSRAHIDLSRYPQLLTAGEVATILRCSSKTVRRYGDQGKLQKFSRGGSRNVFFKKSDVAAMIRPA